MTNKMTVPLRSWLATARRDSRWDLWRGWRAWRELTPLTAAIVLGFAATAARAADDVTLPRDTRVWA